MKAYCKPVKTKSAIAPQDMDDLMTNTHTVIVLKEDDRKNAKEFILDMAPHQYGFSELFFRPVAVETYVSLLQAEWKEDIKDPRAYLKRLLDQNRNAQKIHHYQIMDKYHQKYESMLLTTLK